MTNRRSVGVVATLGSIASIVGAVDHYLLDSKLAAQLLERIEVPTWVVVLFGLVLLAIIFLSRRALGTEALAGSAKAASAAYDLLQPYQAGADRQKAVGGTWSGEVKYDSYSPAKRHAISFQVDASGPGLMGKASYSWEGSDTKLHAIGRFITDSFIRVDYSNKAPGMIHFGVIILRLNATASELVGRFVAFGRFTESVQTGSIDLRKV